MARKFTPERIEKLKPGEIFVFGSNMNGAHMGGAAHIAYENFGAKWGESEGLTGHSYAIPTLDKNMEKVSEGALEASIDKFIGFVLNNRYLTFYLTKIGCGIAGWDIEDVKRIFWKVIEENYKFNSEYSIPINLIIPIEFYDRTLEILDECFSKNKEVMPEDKIHSICQFRQLKNLVEWCQNQRKQGNPRVDEGFSNEQLSIISSNLCEVDPNDPLDVTEYKELEKYWEETTKLGLTVSDVDDFIVSQKFNIGIEEAIKTLRALKFTNDGILKMD